MRVIAGTAKGTKLAPVPAGVRPVSDRVREGVFSSVAPDVTGSRVLDLFAGTGAMGIEALSRGAERVTFVDSARASIALIRSNLERTRLASRADIVRAEVLAFLTGSSKTVQRVGLVFLDPPYEYGPRELEPVVEAIASGWLDPRGATVVLTRGRQSSMPVIPVDWPSARRLSYGDSLVVLYRP